jgi:hypothetical protein
MGFDDKLNDLLLRQDIYAAEALAEYKKNPSTFATYINTAKQNILDNALNKHNELYDKAIGDLERANDVQKNIYYYHQRNVDLNNIQEEVYNNMAVTTENNKILNDNARRQFEINEWTINNRRDTLFVFQIIFISILLNTVFLALYRYGITGGAFYTFVTFFIVIIMVFIIINRANYTEQIRDKRHWNRRTFFKAPAPTVPECPAFNNITGDIESAVSGAATAVSGAASAVSGAVSGAAAVTPAPTPAAAATPAAVTPAPTPAA